jgi:hypothetical protein
MMVISIVQIHGNYCGPNWTHGRAIPASRYSEFAEVAPIDALDRACMAHDKDCSMGGCSARGDRKLIKAALLVSLTTRNPALAAKAKLIAAGITAASLTRSR